MRAAVFGAMLALGACSSGDGDGDGGEKLTRDFPTGAFDRIALAGSHDVVVSVGGAASVRAEGRARALDRLDIAADGGVLRIGSRERRGFSLFGSHGRVTVHVTVPALAGARVAGSGEIRVDRVDGERFEGSVTGSGDLAIAELRTAEARFAVTGSGGIRAAGAVRRATAAVTGSGDVELGGLEAEEAVAELTGSGDIEMRATGTARVDLRGSGDVRVSGPARCTVNKVGSGDVRCGD